MDSDDFSDDDGYESNEVFDADASASVNPDITNPDIANVDPALAPTTDDDDFLLDDPEIPGVEDVVDEDENDDDTETKIPGVANEAEDNGNLEIPGVETVGVEDEHDSDSNEDGEPNDIADIEAQMDAHCSEHSGAHNLCPRKPLLHAHLHSQVHSDTAETTGVGAATTGVASANEMPLATPQMSMRKGLKVFGQVGFAAVGKEMKQLHNCKVMGAKSPKELTPEQHKEALAHLMFLKWK